MNFRIKPRKKNLFLRVFDEALSEKKNLDVKVFFNLIGDRSFNFCFAGTTWFDKSWKKLQKSFFSPKNGTSHKPENTRYKIKKKFLKIHENSLKSGLFNAKECLNEFFLFTDGCFEIIWYVPRLIPVRRFKILSTNQIWFFPVISILWVKTKFNFTWHSNK